MATTRWRWLLAFSAFPVVGSTVLLIFSIPSAAFFGSHPPFEETRDFIILKLSGTSAAAKAYCDKNQECRGVVKTTWENKITNSPSFCSVEVTQIVDVTKTQNTACVWTGDLIGGRLWNQVTYQREYHFALDFASIARDDITVEQATPEKSQCFVIQADLPYAVHLNFTKGINVRFQLRATGSGSDDKTTSAQEGTAMWNNDSFTAGSEDTAQRLAQAFEHAASLCGAKKEIF